MNNGVSYYLWNYVGRFGSQLITLLSQFILARILQPEDFGTIAILSILIMVSSTLVDSGLGGALLMEKKLTGENTSTIFHFNMIVSITIYVVIYLTAPTIEKFYLHDNLSTITRIMGSVFVFQAIGIVPNAILMYKLEYKQISVIAIVSNTVSSGVAIFFAFKGLGVYSLILQQLLNAFLNAGSLFFASHWRPNFVFSRKSLSRMFSFGIFTTLANVIDTVFENIISTIFGKTFNVATAGNFYQAKKLNDASTISLLGTINTTSFSILSKLKDSKDEFIIQSEKIQKTIPIIIIPILVIISVYSKEIVLILFGAKWIMAASYLKLLSISAFFIVYDAIFRTFLKSYGAVRVLTISTFIKRIIGIGLILLAVIFNPDFIIYSYMLSAVIACIINLCSFVMTIGKDRLRFMRKFIEHCLFFALFMVLIASIYKLFSFSLTIPLVLFLTICYYLLFGGREIYKKIKSLYD